MRYSYLILYFIAFIGCATSYPSWYINQEYQNNYIYGVGEGKSLNEAKSLALSDIAAQISLEIKSSLDIKNTYIMENDTQNIYKQNNNDINISVDDIGLNNIEYTNIEEIKGIFYVKARIEKSALISKLNDDIESYIKQIDIILDDTKTSSCSSLSPKHRNELSNIAHNAEIKAMQIQSLKGNSSYISKLKQITTLLSTTSKAYVSNNSKLDDESLDSALKAEYGKFFSLDNKTSGEYNIIQSYEIKGLDSTNILLNVSINDCNNNAIFNTSIESSGKDKKSTIDRLKAQLYKKLYKWQEDNF